jgi:DNA recombination protein RmuC
MTLSEIGIFIFGFLSGAIIIVIIFWYNRKSAEQLAKELARATQLEKVQELEKIILQMKESFAALSSNVLSKSTGDFLRMANQQFSDQYRRTEDNLKSKKELIDNTFNNMKNELSKVQDLVTKIEKDRKQSYGQLSEQLKNSVEQTQKLQTSTQKLNKALTNSQVRGQWGERMAEDVLRLTGLVEGVNYHKQKTLEQGSRPDFTFFLPNDLCVNMDVKFPLANYMAYLNSENDYERTEFKKQFLKDVRQRIKEVSNRDYINPTDNTVDYMIVFIPNEQVYAFINENDAEVLDEALKNKVILSSPITLYAILAVIRQSVENFNLEKTAEEILSLLSDFSKQWEMFKDGMDRMGKRIEAAQKEYDDLVTTRKNQLEKPLRRIDSIRSETDIFLPESDKENF